MRWPRWCLEVLLLGLLHLALAAGASRASCPFDTTRFTAAVPLLSGAGAMEGAAVCDLNGDAVPDVALAPAGLANYRFLVANTAGGLWNGTFTPVLGPTFVSAGGRGLASGDLNRDGKPDLVTVDGPYLTALLSPPTGFIVGGTPNRATLVLGGLQPRLADLDRDGWLDVIVARGSNGVSVVKGGSAAPPFGYGFGSVTNIATTGTARNVALADLDHNGALDLVVAITTFDLVVVPGLVDALARPTGAFGAPYSLIVTSPGRAAWDVVAADFDEDGWEDLAVAVRASSGPSSIVVLMNQGDGTFGTPVPYDVTGAPKSLIATDVDKDGILDVVAAATDAATVSLLQGVRVPGFQLQPPLPVGVPRDGDMLAAGDIDNDGANEIVVPGSSAVLLRGACEPGVYSITTVVSGPGRVQRQFGTGRIAGGGSFLRFIATPTVAEHHFAGWSADTSGTMNPLQFVASRNRTYRAEFTRNEYTLNVTIEGGGTVLRDPDLPLYRSGTVVTLTEIPDEGFSFSHWSGDASGPNVTTTVTMTGGNKNVTAHFATTFVPLTVTLEGVGSVAKSPDLAAYPVNSSVTLDAVPGEGYLFHHWGGALTGSVPSQTLVMSAARSVTATFVPDPRSPLIRAVKDLPADQGGRVKLEWSASSLDIPPSAPTHVGSYLVFRDVPTAAAKAAILAGAARLLAAGGPPENDATVYWHTVDATGEYFWEYLATVPAAGFPGYSYVAATTLDSSVSGPAWTRFKLQARTTDGTGWFNSAPDSGKSVDNLAPQTPSPVALDLHSNATAVHWAPNPEPDLARYRVYRGSTADFPLDPVTFLAELTDTVFHDPTNASAWYKVTATDVHGNESGATAVFASRNTDVEVGPPARLAFTAFPNPAPGRTVLTLSLPRSGRIQVSVLDAGGRRVARLADDTRAAGHWPLAWDGRDEGGRAVPGGIYFALGECGGERVVTRIVLLR